MARGAEGRWSYDMTYLEGKSSNGFFRGTYSCLLSCGGTEGVSPQEENTPPVRQPRAAVPLHRHIYRPVLFSCISYIWLVALSVTGLQKRQRAWQKVKIK
jgi:hypothetical protein